MKERQTPICFANHLLSNTFANCPILKPACIQAFFSSFFLACRTCVLGFQLVWSVLFEMLHPRNLCLGSFDCYFISTKQRICLGLRLDCSARVHSILFSLLDSNNSHPLWNTYLKPIFFYHICSFAESVIRQQMVTAVWRSFASLRAAHKLLVKVKRHIYDVIRDVERKKERHLRQWKNECTRKIAPFT